MDCGPPGSSVCGILQARILESVAIAFLQGNLPNPGIEPTSPALASGFFTLSHQGSPTRLSGLLINVVSRDAKGRTHHPTLLTVTPNSLRDRLAAAFQALQCGPLTRFFLQVPLYVGHTGRTGHA